MGDELLILFPVFFLIAFFYSTAGFGGGSSYLAILALFSFEYSLIKTTALLCNITVVSGNTLLFYKKGLIPFSKILPLVILSVPLAFFGGWLILEERLFFIVLGITLLLASVLMLMKSRFANRQFAFSKWTNTLLGGGVGFLSGLVGIGGGIFLAPVLHIANWDKAKVIAAAASCFILVNSIAGVLGQAYAGSFNVSGGKTLVLLLAVGFGGFLGSRLTINILRPQQIRIITAVLIAIVAIRILVEYIWI